MFIWVAVDLLMIIIIVYIFVRFPKSVVCMFRSTKVSSCTAPQFVGQALLKERESTKTGVYQKSNGVRP